MPPEPPSPPGPDAPAPLLLTGCRILDLDAPGGPPAPTEMLISGGRISRIGPGPRPAGARVVDAEGRFAIPGLWDQHVHFSTWAQLRHRLDLAQTTSPEQALALVASALVDRDGVNGFGFRRAAWDREPTVAELDAICGERPVVLVSGDAHCAWVSTAAQRRLAVSEPFPGLIAETDWFALAGSLEDADGGDAELLAAEADAAALGVVGVVDFDFDDPWRSWPERTAAGQGRLRVRAATYPDSLAAAIAAGHRTGDVLDARGLVTMGPLKIISDGSLGTMTAHCRACYPGGTSHGVQNTGPDELADLLGTARRHGLSAAVHAIGDAALDIALAAFASSGAAGSIEHAQLNTAGQRLELARLGLTASVQPAHLIDDRDLVPRYWPGREADCFPLASMLRAGVALALGSDAPVSPLQPWLAISAAVTRSGDGRGPWVAEEALSVAEALRASVDDRRLRVGEPGDVVLLERNPLEPDPGRLGTAGVAGLTAWLTVLGGRITHGA